MIDQTKIGNGMTCQTACFFNAFFIASGAKTITPKDYEDMNRVYKDIWDRPYPEKLVSVRRYLYRSITLFDKKMRIKNAGFISKEDISKWQCDGDFIAIGIRGGEKLGDVVLRENHAVLAIDSDKDTITIRNSWKGFKDIKVKRSDILNMKIIDRMRFSIQVIGH